MQSRPLFLRVDDTRCARRSPRPISGFSFPNTVIRRGGQDNRLERRGDGRGGAIVDYETLRGIVIGVSHLARIPSSTR